MFIHLPELDTFFFFKFNWDAFGTLIYLRIYKMLRDYPFFGRGAKGED